MILDLGQISVKGICSKCCFLHLASCKVVSALWLPPAPLALADICLLY